MAQDTHAEDSTTCALLELPAELRNRIYRLALCQSNKITVSQTAFQQPALLQSCRQIRQEASAIYCLENRFTIQFHNFNPSVAVSWAKHAGPYRREARGGIGGDLGPATSRRSWSNLMRWIKLAVNDDVFDLAQSERAHPSWNVAAGAMQIAETLYEADTDWEEIEKVLEIYKISTKHTVDWED